MKSKNNFSNNDFFIPFKTVGESKFDFFTSFITTILFGQASICISFCIAFFYWKLSYITDLLKNGDLFTVSIALLGTYFGIILTEFKEKDSNYLKSVKCYVLATSIVLIFFCAIFLVALKNNPEMWYFNNVVVIQVSMFIISTVLSIYSLLLINCNKYIREKEKENDSEEYLKEENNSLESIKFKADINTTSEGDLL